MYRSSIIITAIAFANAVNAVPITSNYTLGFQNPVITPSSNGSATCITGLVSVPASATNVELNLDIPTNQSVVTQVFLNLVQAGSTFQSQVSTGPANISNNYMINARLCYPSATGINSSAIQILTHGIGFGLTYWDLALGYSYVDVAAAYGYTTFLYDRLGVGGSEKSDPLQVQQGPLETAIAHSLTQMLRNGSLASTSFANVIGVGHSYGSLITSALSIQYPEDLDAAILTAFTMAQPGFRSAIPSLDLQIASENNPVRFSTLDNGYVIPATSIGNQFMFLEYPGFPAGNLEIADVEKNTISIGELLSFPVSGNATAFTGPVSVVNGINDLPFCGGNCTYNGIDQTADVQTMYPVARTFSSYNVPLTGHGINLHYSASDAFVRIQNFLKANGL